MKKNRVLFDSSGRERPNFEIELTCDVAAPSLPTQARFIFFTDKTEMAGFIQDDLFETGTIDDYEKFWSDPQYLGVAGHGYYKPDNILYLYVGAQFDNQRAVANSVRLAAIGIDALRNATNGPEGVNTGLLSALAQFVYDQLMPRMMH